LSIDPGFDHAGIPEDPEVLGHGGLAHPETDHQVAHRALPVAEQFQDVTSMGVGQYLEGGAHSFSMLYSAYNCQCICPPVQLESAVATLRRTMTTPAMNVEDLQRFLADAFPTAPPPYRIEAVSSDTIRIRLPVGDAESRPGGTVSGPSLMALADCTAWLVIVAQIGPVALSVTTSLHIDFLRKPALVDVVAVGSLLKLGQRLAVADVAMYSVGREAVVAKAQVTYSIPPR
jgi:uncharacterized protein (TIGR00369 family)